MLSRLDRRRPVAQHLHAVMAAGVPRGLLLVTAGLGVAVLVLCGIAAFQARRMAPMVRARLSLVLGQQLHTPVQVGPVCTRSSGGLQVEIDGLAAQSVLRGVVGDPGRPMLRIQHVSLQIGLWQAMLGHIVIHDGAVRGVTVVLPPGAAVASGGTAPLEPASEIHLDRLTLEDVHVTFTTSDSQRAPLRFDIAHAVLTGLDRSEPAAFDATVDNGSPIGLVQTSGTIGSWNVADPRATPLQGTFAFGDRSVASVPGLLGSLSMQARYQGTLGLMTTQGETEDPAFGLDVSAHTVALHTVFALQIDAVHGLVRMTSIDAHFNKTHFVLSGTVTRNVAPAGYELDMELSVLSGRMEDALMLAAKSQPPLLRGALTMRGRMLMPAGPDSVSRRLALRNGHFHLTEAQFGKASVQRNVDAMNERASGRPKDATADNAVASTAQADGEVGLQHAVLHVAHLRMREPGSQMSLAGTYALGSSDFALSGTLHTDAKASQMQTGWKGLLTRPFNTLFSHGKAGATMPIRVTGRGNMPEFQVGLPGGGEMKAMGMKKDKDATRLR